MFDETPIFHVKFWNHPIEATIKKWLFREPGLYKLILFFWICLVDDYLRILPLGTTISRNMRFIFSNHLFRKCKIV